MSTKAPTTDPNLSALAEHNDDTPTPATPRGRGGRRYSLLTSSDRSTITAMTAIPAALHIALVWIPALGTFLLSFTNWNGVRWSSLKWVGLRNYKQLFTVFEKDLYESLLNNLWVMLALFFVGTPLGMFIAYILDKNLRGSAVYQSVFYAPVVLSLAVVGFIWKSVMYSPGQGVLNSVLGRTGSGNQIDWLGNPDRVIAVGGEYGLGKNFLALVVAMIWIHVGYVMVLYLAGLKSVDPTLREAAAIDGANEWQVFRKVVLPSMKPVNIVVLVITVITSLRVFDIIDVLNNPIGTDVLSILVTDNILGESGNVGRGSAYGVVLLLVCFVFAVVYLRNAFSEDDA